MPNSFGPRNRTVWRDRVKVLADASGVSPEGLGELVETELSRCDSVLFTVTPAEELDEVSRWARLGDAAWCGQVRAVVGMHNRMQELEREFLACEVALALNLSTDTAEELVATALLAASLPGLVEAVEVGMLTVRHAYAVIGTICGRGLSAEAQVAVVTIGLARYDGQTPAELGRLLEKLILKVDPAEAKAREQRATKQRHVRFRAIGDGQGQLIAQGPMAMIEAVRASLEATLPLTAEPGDERSRDERELDLLVDLITGGWDRVPEEGAGGGWQPTIVVPYDTAAGGDLELAEIPGLGPVLPSTARELLDLAVTVTRIAVDADGQVLDVTPGLPGPASCTDSDPTRWLRELTEFPIRIGVPASSGYQPSARLRRFVEARDRTCTFPGCNRPARKTDKDHRLPFPLGLTDEDNLHSLCRRHHRAKQRLFTVIKLPDGTTRWITRGGWWFDRRPQGW